MTEQEGSCESDLDVAAAHVVLVTLQCEISVFWVDETNQSFAVSPALSIKTEGHTTPETQVHKHIHQYEHMICSHGQE